jgi:hypothetical protein
MSQAQVDGAHVCFRSFFSSFLEVSFSNVYRYRYIDNCLLWVRTSLVYKLVITIETHVMGTKINKVQINHIWPMFEK